MDAVLAVSVSDELLWVGSEAMFLLLDSAPGWSDNGQIRKTGEDTKMAASWNPSV